MPARRQAIIWTNDAEFTDAFMRYSGMLAYTHQQNQAHNMSRLKYGFIVSTTTIMSIVRTIVHQFTPNVKN